MAVTITDDRTEIDDADTVGMTGWASPVAGETLTHFTSDPLPVEGTGCIGIAVSEEVSEVVHQITATDISDHIIYVWISAKGTMEVLANGGITMFLSDDTDDIAYHIAGADAAVFRHSQGPVDWQCMALDTTNPPSGFEVVAGVEANLTFTALTEIGAQFETLSKALGGAANCFIDRIMTAGDGVGLTIIGGTTGARGTFAEVATDDRSNTAGKAYGIVRDLGGNNFSAQGPLTFGDTAGVTVHYFEDLDGSLTFEDRGFAAGRYPITVQGNSTGIGSWVMGVLVGSGDTRSGSNGWIFKWPSGQAAAFTASDADLDIMKLYGGAFIGAGALAFSDDATNAPNHDCAGWLFQDCGQAAINRVPFRDVTFDAYAGSEGGAVLWNANADIKNSLFQGCSEGVEHPTAGTFSHIGLLYTGNTADVNNSSNATNEIALSFAGVDATLDLDDTNNGGAQSFTVGGTNRQLSSMACELAAVGSPTGMATMKLYSDSASLPNAVLATTDMIDVSTLGAAATISFSFNDADEQFLMLASTVYWATIEYSSGTATDYITVGTDAGGGLAGAHAILNGSWASGGTPDQPIEVRYDGIVEINASGGADPGVVVNTGTPPGATIINNTVTLSVTCLDADGNGILGVRVRIETDPAGTLITEGTTNGSGVYSDSSYNFGGNQDVNVVTRLKGFVFVTGKDTIVAGGLGYSVTLNVDTVVELP